MARPFPPLLLCLLLGCGGKKDEPRDNDHDGYSAAEDCNDAHPGIHPGAPEGCNGRDDDCDGEVDGGIQQTFWPDEDGDGYGRSEEGVLDCLAPTGDAELEGDCDDEAIEAHPGATELCNGLDEDCDGEADPGAAASAYTDLDGDGYGDSTTETHTCLLEAGQVWEGDGIGDIVVPAVYASEGPSNSGVTYILTGPLSGTTTMDGAAGAYSGLRATEYSGYCVSQGDVDGDGLADAVIGSYSGEMGAEGGAVYVVFGPAAATDSLDVADLIIYGEIPHGVFGMGHTAGDIDHDGVDELFVGAPMEDGGAAYLFMGPQVAGTMVASDATVHLLGEHVGDALGHGLAIGDFDGDGWADLAMGAYNEGSGGSAGGAVYLQFAYE